jgi:flagellar hook-associated protein 2
MTINIDNINVDANGRTSFSGLSSGIDFRGAIDSIIAAKRIPIDSLETKVVENADRITALQDLRSSLNGMRDALSTLYGAVSFQNTQDIFENKQAFGSTSRVDGQTAPASANLAGISVTNEAQLGSFSIDVIQTAAGNKISSKAFTATNTSLGLTANDSFTIEGVTLTVSGTETLVDLRNRINNANSGTNATGVTASIVSVSSTENYLILTRAGGDAAMALTETTGTPLRTLGIFDGSGAVANTLQVAQMAQFYADGLLDQTNTIYESSYQSSGTVQVGSTGEITFAVGSPAVNTTVAYASTDTLQTRQRLHHDGYRPRRRARNRARRSRHHQQAPAVAARHQHHYRRFRRGDAVAVPGKPGHHHQIRYRTRPDRGQNPDREFRRQL